MLGSESYKSKVQKEVKEQPVLLSNIVMAEVKTESHLGDNMTREADFYNN